MAQKDTIRIAAIGDLHFGRTTPPGSQQPLFARIAESADVLVLAGDITDYGLLEEARAFAKELAPAKLPTVAVLGNHDFESNQQDDIAKCLKDVGVAVLDGETTEIRGIGFAGVKGFAGGFGRRALGPWGEDIVKKFVHEAVNEALKLESALARLRNQHIVAILHYAPIQGTVEGEPRDIYPYLGCSRLEDPLTRFPVSAVFHGHAHHGTPEGRTRTNVPVYNVSASLMRERFPDRPFQLVELGATPPVAGDRRGGADRRAAAEISS
jgi:Icc-related predicted phosphoesterase